MPSPIPFYKYHALGNDYIVLTPDEFGQEITVHMPGGRIEIEIAPDYAISMTGGVTKVATGTMDPEMLTWKEGVIKSERKNQK